ncbi:alpha/beta hydrolase [Jiangella ureilytica]|uniref:Alpha/beta hydrolase n=1 Tax=Jiangella ureilytica TaxID=2530374 RepID=A0A4R4RKN8_9ACTN|nr:alpha/beta hydrolase [Jiangella ureilytica]TDC49936.1 alpha/beta hydrolase [Jiangella ureilytica]
MGSGWSGHEYTLVGRRWMHAAVRGPASAREVVCVPGLGVSHRYYLRLGRALDPGARTVAVDLPGFGRSAGPARALDVRGLSRSLASWLRSTGRSGAPLVANSAGCQVVVDLAAHAPELLGPVVLIGPTMDRAARHPLRQVARLLADTAYERPDVWLLIARDYLQCGLRRPAATFAHLLADPVERKLGDVPVEAVVVRGRHDPIAPRAWTAALAAGLPHGCHVEIPAAGHVTHHRRPEAVAAVIGELLRTRAG